MDYILIDIQQKKKKTFYSWKRRKQYCVVQLHLDSEAELLLALIARMKKNMDGLCHIELCKWNEVLRQTLVKFTYFPLGKIASRGLSEDVHILSYNVTPWDVPYQRLEGVSSRRYEDVSVQSNI